LPEGIRAELCPEKTIQLTKTAVKLLTMLQHQKAKKLLCLLLLTILLQIPFLLHAQPGSEKAFITISGDKISLKAVFDEIKKQTNYDVVYNPKEVDVSEKVTVHAKKQLLETFLGEVLSQRSLTYSFMKSTILVLPRKPAAAASSSEPAPDAEMAGLVMEEKNRSPLFGVSVMVKRTGKGTQSDAQGFFKLKDARVGDTVIFSIIGYQTTRMEVPAGSMMRVAMKIAVDQLDETIVQAYGTTTRRLSTGTIVKVSGDEIRKEPGQNPLMALMGKVPGMSVLPTSTYAHAPIKVEIRGRKSLDPNFSGEPLYIVDGVPISTLPLQNLLSQKEAMPAGAVQGGVSVTGGQSPLFAFNQNDIESIEVLMDADATAIYGSRGANGVIIITTKKPKGGKASLSLGVDQSFTDIPYFPKYLSPSQYFEIRREAFRNDGALPSPSSAPDLALWDTTRYTDWQRLFYGPGRVSTFSARLSGGDEQASMALSSQYINTKGMNRWTGSNEALTLGFSSQLRTRNKKLSVQFSLNYTYTWTDAIDIGQLSMNLPPNAPPVLDSKGDPNYEEWTNGAYASNYEWASLFRPNETSMKNLAGNLSLTYYLFNNLTWTSTIGYSTNNNDNNYFQPIRSQNPVTKPIGSAIFGMSKSENLTVSSRLQYNMRFGKASTTIELGFEGNKQQATGISINATGYTNDYLLRSLSNAPNIMAFDTHGERRTLGTFARVSFNWDQKYIFNLSFNRDGSSQFGSDNQFGSFGSIGAGWIASDEKWLKKILPSWFSFLKFRSNYGITGNNNVGDYQYLSQWSASPSPTATQKLFDYNGQMPFVPVIPVNQRYQWEKTSQLSSGLDMGFLQQRLTVGLEWYRNITDHQIMNVPTPAYTGFLTVKGNSPGVMLNEGWTISLNGTIISNKDLRWTVSLNGARNRNIVKSFPGLEKTPWYRRYKVGEPVNTAYLLHYLGVDPLTGNASFEDYNKDGVVNAGSSQMQGTPGNDYYVELNLDPVISGGIGTSISYKGFSFYTSCIYSYRWMRDPFMSRTEGSMRNFYLPDEVWKNTWRKPGDQAKYPRFTNSAINNNMANSDAGYSKIFYLRLSAVNLSYALPPAMLKKIRLSSCTISVNASNFFTITKYKGVDPVTAGQPIQRQINTRLSITI
jgi:TonB-linked SusC/RagA family outer membrane protein